jgi:hypothetical protein
LSWLQMSAVEDGDPADEGGRGSGSEHVRVSFEQTVHRLG